MSTRSDDSVTSSSTLYLDCFSGASGDMLVATLLDLGLPQDELSQALEALHLPDHYHLHFSKEERHGILASRFTVHVEDHHHDHEPSHLNHEHSHGRNFSEIREIIQTSSLPSEVIHRSISAFERLAIAEGSIHGLPHESVPFHEVGAVDSIIDIVSFCWGIHRLGIREIIASPLVDGRGFVRAAHGMLPIPVPATLACLKGIPIRQLDEPYEMITPTGATLLAEFVSEFIPMPSLEIDKIGYGAGSRNLEVRPNVIRGIVGKKSVSSSHNPHQDQVIVLETHVDDSTGEQLGHLMEILLKRGALDVCYAPITMKKNRPGIAITVVLQIEKEMEIVETIFRESTAFGLRKRIADRWILQREITEVTTDYGSIAVKIGRWNGEIVQKAPEYESCKIAAEKNKVPLMTVYQAAKNA